jgi:hypothetical protein
MEAETIRVMLDRLMALCIACGIVAKLTATEWMSVGNFWVISSKWNVDSN